MEAFFQLQIFDCRLLYLQFALKGKQRNLNDFGFVRKHIIINISINSKIRFSLN